MNTLVITTVLLPFLVAASPADRGSAFQQALDAARDSLHAHGASACVILADGTTWTGASGVAHGSEPLTPETRFEVGSITKAFTAALVLQLVGDGILDLDDTVDRWMPDVRNAETTTLRHLLNHTSGLTDPYDNPQMIPSLVAAAARRWTTAEVLEFMAEPAAPPGETWEYSSANYMILAVAVREQTGAPVAATMRRRVFEPLGLVHTVYAADEEVSGPLAHAYLDVNNDGTEEDLTAMLPSTAFLTAAGAAGSIVSTARDVAVFMRAFVTGEFLSPAMHEAMFEWVDRGDGQQHGLGVLRMDRDGVDLVGHRGNSAGYSGAAWHAPAEGVTITVLTNRHGVLVTAAVESLLDVALE